MNGVISVAQCCCDETPAIACDVYASCEDQVGVLTTKAVVPSYVTIGRPTGPTIYDGPFWVAWHNGVSPIAQTLFGMTLKVWKRTVVQSDCSGGTCPTLPIPKVAADCLTQSGTVTSSAGCAKTEYVDYYEWSMNETISIIGARADQDIAIQQNITNGDIYDGTPPGPWPCYLTDCGSSPCADPESPVATGNNPNWWPGENRSIVPRYFKSSASITSSSTPAGSYPVTAACGSTSFVNRCSATTSTETRQVCIDLPITIVPGHETKWTAAEGVTCGFFGSPAIGGGTFGCCVDCYENGAREAAWGLDIKEDGLVNALLAMGFTSSQYVGSLGGSAWMTMVSGNGRVRFLFGMLSRLSSGQTFKFQEGASGEVKESGNFTFQAEGVSYYCEIELSVTAKGWCNHNPRCGCVQSYAENGPSAILVQAFIQPGGGGGGVCTACASSPATVAYSLGLCRYDIPSWHFFGYPSCMQFPVNTDCIPFHPPSGPILEDYVGDKPVERYHPGWQKYRNKYDHYFCINTLTGNLATCCTGAVAVNTAPIDVLCMPGCVRMTSAWITANLPCPGSVPGCINNLDFPNTIPAGCNKVDYIGGQFEISPEEPPGCLPCSPQWFQCGTMFFRADCGTALFYDCDCCNNTPVATLPDVMIVDWDPTNSCWPDGRNDIYWASVATQCDRSAWFSNGSYAIIS